MEIKDLKILFDNGGLKKATIASNVMGAGYIVFLMLKTKDLMLLQGKEQKVRHEYLKR
ncbi:hypothetical protein AB6D87_24585 [Vibrio lentus]